MMGSSSSGFSLRHNIRRQVATLGSDQQLSLTFRRTSADVILTVFKAWLDLCEFIRMTALQLLAAQGHS
jgi:hypothetical protein